MREHEHDMLFRREEIAARVAEIGAQISHDFAGEAILLVGVLKGAAVFLADLARSISVETTFDFVAISSYKGVKTSGAVRLLKDIDTPIGGRNVILVEDILDTGLTLVFLRKLLQQHKPKTLKIATCLDKPAGGWRRSTPTTWHLPFPIISSWAMEWIIRNAFVTCPTSASTIRMKRPIDLSLRRA